MHCANYYLPTASKSWRTRQGVRPRPEDFLRHFTSLSRKYPTELARSAVETAILRREALDKFPQAQKMYFTTRSFGAGYWC